MTYIGVQETEYQVEDRSWDLSPHGSEPGTTPSITLDVSAFTKATHYANGYFPSGLPLGKISATGLYGPYGGRSNEVQEFDLGAASAGTFTITFDGETTDAIAFDATAATVQTALEGLSNINPGDVAATGGPLPGTAVVLTFGGQYAGEDVPEITIDGSGLTGATVTITTTTAGGSSVSDGREVCAGLLFASTKVPDVDDTTKDVGAALKVHGFVDADKLPVTLDAAGQSDLTLIHFA